MISTNPTQTRLYLETLFAAHSWRDDQFALLRGVGEKGGPSEGNGADDVPVLPAIQDLAGIAAGCCRRWHGAEMASFIVPAVLREPRATEEHVMLLPAVYLDLDSVPAREALAWLEETIGRPSMVIRSGGTNPWGAKYHAAYVLEEPGEPTAVSAVATALAGISGGDNIFLRRTQPVRIPGSVHLKGGIQRLVELESYSDDRFTLEEIKAKIAAAGQAYYLDAPDVIEARGKASTANRGTGAAFTGFSPWSGVEAKDLVEMDIKEGGQSGMSRFDAFSAVAGHYISQARRGDMALPEAKAALRGWVLARMQPPWEPTKVEREWARLVAKDVREHGPMPEPEVYVSVFDRFEKSMFSPSSTIMPPELEGVAFDDPSGDRDGMTMAEEAAAIISDFRADLDALRHAEGAKNGKTLTADEVVSGPWDKTVAETGAFLAAVGAVAGNPATVAPAPPAPPAPSGPPILQKMLANAGHRWMTDPAPATDWLVEGLIARGEQHMFASEGGSGKSYAMLDLGMRIAAWKPEEAMPTGGLVFTPGGGEPLPDCHEWLGRKIRRGGTVVLFLNEDSQLTLHQRGIKLAGGDRALLKAAGDRFIPLPMPALGGAFVFCDKDGRPTPEWRELLDGLRAIPDLALVVWDTFSTMLHGSEIDSTVVNQMMRQANLVTGELGAASLFLHHVRKSGAGDPAIQNAIEMKAAVRGSSAIMGAMRLVIGMWRAHDWPRRAKALGQPPHPDSVWKVAVVKTNLDDTMGGERTIIRQDYRLKDVTDLDPYASGNMQLRLAWLELAIVEAARDGYPFTAGGKNDTNGLYQRRHQLPEELSRIGRERLVSLAMTLVEQKKLVLAAAKGGQSAKWFDQPKGKYATNDMGEEVLKGAWKGREWSKWVFDPGQERCIFQNDTLV